MRRFLIHCLLITAATIAAYLPVAGHDFVSFDDEHYLLEHDHVRNGLTSDSVHWAFTTGYMSNWHPITWLSFMLDAQFFGLDPGRFHVVNVIFHAANALLLFALLARTTGATWPSLLVAVLFALHPLHVESVAWVSQRKDVLSTCFGLLCIIAYVSYTQRGGAARYILVIILAALGLMSKPMLVTWPFVLLLFDFWPLNRIRTSQSGLLFSPPFHEGNGGGSPPHETPAPSSTHTSHTKQTTALISLHRAVIEKIPLFLLAATSSFITYHVQHAGGSMANTHAVAAAPRIANAVVSYVRYLGKTIWPTDLCILYPHPDAPGGTPWSAAQIVAAAALLLLITALCFAIRRRYLIVGWLWFIGTLVPVIGIIQVGRQAMADRYTYIPLIGLFVAVVWAAHELILCWRRRAPWLIALTATTAAVALLGLLTATLAQVRTWRDSQSLYQHALRVEPNNPLIHYNLGELLQQRGQLDPAARHYQAALRLDPTYADAYHNLATVHYAHGQLDQAIAAFRRALLLDTASHESHSALAMALQVDGRLASAAEHYQMAMQHGPPSADLLNNLAMARRQLGLLDAAILTFRQAVQLDPSHDLARRNLAGTSALQRDLEKQLDTASPADAAGEVHHGIAAAMLGRFETMHQHFRRALAQSPDDARLAIRIARIWSTHPNRTARNPQRALAIAQHACRTIEPIGPDHLETLAACHAAVGDYEAAINTAAAALEPARDDQTQRLTNRLIYAIERYRHAKPYREPVGPLHVPIARVSR